MLIEKNDYSKAQVMVVAMDSQVHQDSAIKEDKARLDLFKVILDSAVQPTTTSVQLAATHNVNNSEIHFENVNFFYNYSLIYSPRTRARTR